MIGNNPYEAALDLYSLEEFENILYKYLGPYVESGQMSLNELTDMAMLLMSDPYAVYEMMASTYEQSPGYQYSYDEAMNAVNNAAAAGGMSGTMEHQAYAANTASGMAAQDFNAYMNYMGQLLGGGMKAGGQIAQTGYGASSQMAEQLARYMGMEMGLTAQSAAYDNQKMMDYLTAGLSAISSGVTGGWI